ncbi:hypothetical protein D3C87_570450 [compost metagenome]
MKNLNNTLTDIGLTELSYSELSNTVGGCKEWLFLFGLAGIACYVGWHDASKGKHAS